MSLQSSEKQQSEVVGQAVVTMLDEVQSAYDSDYSDAATAWRELGGKYKAENLLHVCRNHRFKTVLECGAGEGSILKYLDASGAFDQLWAAEISSSGIEFIRKRDLPRLQEVVKFDGYSLPFSDGQFDLVICAHVMEHVEHPRLLLRELRRVSRFQAFEVPLDYSPAVSKRMDYFLGYGHINIYTPSLFKFLLQSEGFEVLEELHTHLHPEVTRFNWYRNMGLKKTLRRDLFLKLHPLRQRFKRAVMGQERYLEFGHTAYTCFTRSTGSLRILGG